MLTVASIRTLKHENKKCGNEEVFTQQKTKNSIDSDINKEDFDKLSKILVKSQAVKRNKVGNGEYLSLQKESVKHDQEITEYN